MITHRLDYREFCKLPEFLLKELENTPVATERAHRYMNTGAHRYFEHRHAANWAWNRMGARERIEFLVGMIAGYSAKIAEIEKVRKNLERRCINEET